MEETTGEGGMATGTVKWYDNARGYGFIAQDEAGAEDLFVHHSQVEDARGAASLEEGMRVEFALGRGKKGPQAERVVVTDVGGSATPTGTENERLDDIEKSLRRCLRLVAEAKAVRAARNGGTAG